MKNLLILLTMISMQSCIKQENLSHVTYSDPIIIPLKGEVEVNYCALPPDRISDKLRAIFAIDVSGSNSVDTCPQSGCPTDPDGMRRYPALLEWVQGRRSIPNFNPENEKYAMYQWSGVHDKWNNQANGADDPDLRFVPIDEFEQIIQTRANDNGGTPYLNTLDVIEARIKAEARAEKEKYDQDQNPDKVITCFDVVTVFVSDGFPTDGAQDETVLRDKVKDLMALSSDPEIGSYICGITINSAFYNSVVLNVAIERLKAIADEGNGEFFNFLGNEPIDYNKVTQVHTRRIVTEPVELIAINNNVVWSLSDKKYMPDMDADGMPDYLELKKCLGKADCDGNDVRDGLEYWVSVSPRSQCKDKDCDPGNAKKFACRSPSGTLYDKDGDQLLDCEEDYVSSSISNFDTNKTGIPDDIKFRNQYIMVKNGEEDSVTDLSSVDSDKDGISDYLEMIHSTPWQYHNELRAGGFKPIKYTPLATYEDKDGSKSGVIGQKCFKYKIEDLTLASGQDSISIYIIDQRFTGGGGDKFLRIGTKKLGQGTYAPGKAKFNFGDYVLKTAK